MTLSAALKVTGLAFLFPFVGMIIITYVCFLVGFAPGMPWYGPFQLGTVFGTVIAVIIAIGCGIAVLLERG